MTDRLLSSRCVLLCMLAAPVLDAAAQGAMPFVQSFSFGMVALGSDQVAKLNTVNIAPAAGMPACAVEVSFLDSQGGVLKSAKLHLESQRAAFLDLDRSEVAGPAGRLQIRATYYVTMPAVMGVLAPGSVCSIAPTLEISDKGSGKSVLVLSDAKMVPLASQPPAALGGRR